MSVRPCSSALSIGVILIILGLIFLIENFYAPFSVVRLIERYWPLILILIGVKKLIGFFLWSEPSPPNDPSRIKE